MDNKQFGNQLMSELGLIRDRTAELLEIVKQTGELQAEGSVDTVKSDIAEMKAYTAELLDLVRQAWSAGTLDNAARDLREALDGLAEFGRVANGITAVRQQLDNVAKFNEQCDRITHRMDRVSSSMDARYGRKWANPLLRHAVKTGVVVVIALAGFGMYHAWLVIQAAFK